MAKKSRITLSQIMAILALVGILLSVVGTAWLTQMPISADSDNANAVMSWEVSLIPSE